MKPLIMLSSLLFTLCLALAIPSRAMAQAACANRSVDQFATAPATIWVEHTKYWDEVPDPNNAIDRVFSKEYSLQDYVKGVVRGELGDAVPFTVQPAPLGGQSWNDAVVSAQAIAARTVIWERMNYAGDYAVGYDPHWAADLGVCAVHDDPTPPINGLQAFRPYFGNKNGEPAAFGNAVYNSIVDATVALYLVQDGGTYPIDAQFKAETGNPTADGAKSYLLPVDDSVSPGDVHDIGLGQFGALRWLNGLGSDGLFYPQWENHLQLLSHYYTDIDVRNADDGRTLTPTYRWALLQAVWDTSDGRPPTSLNPGERRSLNVWIQNSGNEAWAADGAFYFDCLRAVGAADATAERCSEQPVAPTQQVEPGGAFAAAITFIAPSSPICSGFGFDMFRSGESFVSMSVNEVGQAWPTYNVILNVGYGCKTVYAPLVMRSPVVSESSH